MNNVTPITPNKNRVTLSSVLEALSSWRRNKNGRTIPSAIWEQIFTLVDEGLMSRAYILREAGISTKQFRRAEAERSKATQPDNDTVAYTDAADEEDNVNFCEVAQDALAYKPAEAFTTTTSVVELYRPDGMLMKIHICTERFEELLRAFFKG